MERYVQVSAALVDAEYRGRPRIYRRSRGQPLRAPRAYGREAVELSDRSRASRCRGFVLGQRPPICRDHYRISARRCGRRRTRAVSARDVPPRVDARSVRVAGGIAMIRILLFTATLVCAQDLQSVLKQGEEVFSKTCATGYCHGAKGVSGGAPRLAARG